MYLCIYVVKYENFKKHHMDYKHEDFSRRGEKYFPGFIGIEILNISSDVSTAKLKIQEWHFAPNGYVHAGTIVTLADTLAGYSCLYNLPDNGVSFTTMELKTNFIGAAKGGSIKAEATLQHAGKTTQVWDVTVTNEENNKTIALFRCTQLILY